LTYATEREIDLIQINEMLLAEEMANPVNDQTLLTAAPVACPR